MRLNERQRREARKIILEGAHLAIAHKDSIHYTQDATLRWEGIHKGLRVVKGQFPHHADCSSFATWLEWNALTHALRDLTITDVINGQRWLAGYTGSMVLHGSTHDQGHSISHHQPGDCFFYGNGWPWKHVTVSLGGAYCVSFGSEAGPFKLGIDYRGDRHKARRYILSP